MKFISGLSKGTKITLSVIAGIWLLLMINYYIRGIIQDTPIWFHLFFVVLFLVIIVIKNTDKKHDQKNEVEPEPEQYVNTDTGEIFDQPPIQEPEIPNNKTSDQLRQHSTNQHFYIKQLQQQTKGFSSDLINNLQVEVIACSDSCIYCQELDGVVVPLVQELKKPRLPVLHCTHQKGCRCTFGMRRIK